MDNEKTAQNLEGHLFTLLKDKDAVKFCTDLWCIIQTWDDIYDGDEYSQKDLNAAFTKCLVHLPLNPFYIAFAPRLLPLIESSILQWKSANSIEKSDDKESLNKSYMLRAFYYQICHYCSSLLWGEEYAVDNAVVFQSLYGESFKKYSKEFIGGDSA